MLAYICWPISLELNVKSLLGNALLIPLLLPLYNCLSDPLIHCGNVTIVSPLLFYCDLFDGHVSHTFLFFFKLPLLDNLNLLFDLALMTISSIQELTCFLSCDICQLLCPLLFVCKPLDSVFKQLVLLNLILQDWLLLSHLDSCDHWIVDLSVSATAKALLGWHCPVLSRWIHGGAHYSTCIVRNQIAIGTYFHFVQSRAISQSTGKLHYSEWSAARNFSFPPN